MEGRKPAHLRRCYLLVQPTDDTESNPITLASRTCSHWSGKTSSPLPDHQTSLLVQPGCTFQTRVSVCVTRQSCFALRSLVVHPGCTNATAPACNLHWPSVGPGTHRIVKCRFSRSRLVQPVCTNAHVMGPGGPSPPVNGAKEIGLFVAAIGSLYIRPRYNKPLALVKNLFAIYRGHPIAQEATSSVTRHAGRDSSAVPWQPPISYLPAVQPFSLVLHMCKFGEPERNLPCRLRLG